MDDADILLKKWLADDSERAERAWNNLIYGIGNAPLIAEHEIERYVRSNRTMGGNFRTGRDRRKPKPRALVSPREMEVILLVADGLKNREVAMIMGIKYWTVNTYLDRVRSRFDARNTTHLITLMFRKGLLK
jgi:DNA-binding CsgD family transcriptional regulator